MLDAFLGFVLKLVGTIGIILIFFVVAGFVWWVLVSKIMHLFVTLGQAAATGSLAAATLGVGTVGVFLLAVGVLAILVLITLAIIHAAWDF